MRALSKVKRATFRSDSARRPLARTPVTMRALVGCVGGLGVSSVRFGCNPTQGAVETVRYRNYAGPQHFCLFRGMCSAWVPGSVLGSLIREIRAFSSGSVLASPSFRVSFVLRDRGHIKGQIAVTPDRDARPRRPHSDQLSGSDQKAKRRNSE